MLFIGRSLAIVLRYTEFLKQRLRDGARIRLVIVNPDNDAVVKALTPLLETSRNGFIADVRSSMGLVKRIAEAAPGNEQLQLRYIEYVPTLSFAMIDGGLPTGQIVVELVPYQVGPTSRPHFLLTAKDTPVWYSFFHDICERIWQDATPFSLEASFPVASDGA